MRKDKEAVQVIDRISENIRMVFSKSRHGKPYHTLSDELHLVHNYLYVQKVRYGDLLNCQVPSIRNLSHLNSLSIPIMQIQIHVENAIEHGIRNRLSAGWVEVSIEDEGDYVHIQIIDDGVGREKAREMGSGGTQQGVSMLSNLHKIYNQKNENKIEFWYFDLPFVDKKTGEEYGTVAHIRIPKDYHYAVKST